MASDERLWTHYGSLCRLEGQEAVSEHCALACCLVTTALLETICLLRDGNAGDFGKEINRFLFVVGILEK